MISITLQSVEKIADGKWRGRCRVHGMTLGNPSIPYSEVHVPEFADRYQLRLNGRLVTFKQLGYGQVAQVVDQ